MLGPRRDSRGTSRWPRFLLSATGRSLFVIAVVLFLYALFSWIGGTRLFPPIPVVAGRFVDLLRTGALLKHCGASLARILGGLGLSILIWVPVAGLLARYETLDRLFSPLLYAAYPVPKIAFLPAVILLFGLGNASKVTMIVLIVSFQVAVGLRDTFKSIDRRAFESVLAFGGGRLALLRHVIVPSSLPALFSALRISAGTATAVLFIAESFATETGMGFFIMDAWGRVAYADMHVGVLALALLGLGLFALIDGAERLACPWTRA